MHKLKATHTNKITKQKKNLKTRNWNRWCTNLNRNYTIDSHLSNQTQIFHYSNLCLPVLLSVLAGGGGIITKICTVRVLFTVIVTKELQKKIFFQFIVGIWYDSPPLTIHPTQNCKYSHTIHYFQKKIFLYSQKKRNKSPVICTTPSLINHPNNHQPTIVYP